MVKARPIAAVASSSTAARIRFRKQQQHRDRARRRTIFEDVIARNKYREKQKRTDARRNGGNPVRGEKPLKICELGGGGRFVQVASGDSVDDLSETNTLSRRS